MTLETTFTACRGYLIPDIQFAYEGTTSLRSTDVYAKIICRKTPQFYTMT